MPATTAIDIANGVNALGNIFLLFLVNMYLVSITSTIESSAFIASGGQIGKSMKSFDYSSLPLVGTFCIACVLLLFSCLLRLLHRLLPN